MATITNERDALNEIIRIITTTGDSHTWHKSKEIVQIAQQGLASGAGIVDDGIQRDSKAWKDSSTLSQAVYFPATRTLRLHFTSGAIYDFFEVHPSTWNDMKSADSPGRYYNTNIKQHENKKVL